MEKITDITLADLDLIVDALENYKSKGFGLDLMKMMFKSIGQKKEEDMTLEEITRKRMSEEKEKTEAEMEKLERERLKKEIDFLKAKIVLIAETKRRSEQLGLSK